MTDRQRLGQMADAVEAKRKKERKEKEVQQAAQNQAAENSIALSRQKTEELKQYCEKEIAGHKLPSTEWEFEVGTTNSPRHYELKQDGVDYVMLTVCSLPVLVCRYRIGPTGRDGQYEWAMGTRTIQDHPGSFERFKETLLNAVASFGIDDFKAASDRAMGRLR